MSHEKNVPPQRGGAADSDDERSEAKFLDFFPLDSLNQPFTAYTLASSVSLDGPVYRSVGATLASGDEVAPHAVKTLENVDFHRDVLNEDDSFPFPGMTQDIPLVPAWLDAWHSFTTSEMPARVIERLKELYDADASVELIDSDDGSPFQLDALVIRNNEQARVHIAMYRDRSGEAVVEMTRRSGCAFVYNRFFEEAVSRMERLGIAMRRVTRPATALTPLPEPTMDDLPAPQPVGGDVINLLCESGTCGYVDCEKEALKTLSTLSGWRVNQNVFATEIKQLIPVLKSAFNSNDIECRRCAAALMFNLATMARLHPELCEVLPLVFDTIRDCQRKEVRRQLLACLELLCVSNDVRSVMQGHQEYSRIVAYLPEETCYRQIKETVLKAIRPAVATAH